MNKNKTSEIQEFLKFMLFFVALFSAFEMFFYRNGKYNSSFLDIWHLSALKIVKYIIFLAIFQSI